MVNQKFSSSPKDIDKLPTSRSERRLSPEFQRYNQSSDDDVISSLAGSYENVRARQVGEWERAQTAIFSRAA